MELVCYEIRMPRGRHSGETGVVAATHRGGRLCRDEAAATCGEAAARRGEAAARRGEAAVK